MMKDIEIKGENVVEAIKSKKVEEKPNILLLITIFLLFVLFGVGLYINTSQNNKYQLYIVQSGSMKPTINEGSLIFVERTGDYKSGDIITFNKDNKIITHRITQELENENFRTKGDANSAEDLEVVKKSEILGEYIGGVIYLGYLFSFVKSKIGLIVLVIIPCLILIYREILKISDEIKNIRKNK